MSMFLGLGIGIARKSGPTGESVLPSTGPLQVDSFDVLVDSFQIIFS